MNHAPMIQTTARMNALVEQFNRESRDPFHKRISMPSPRSLHYWLCITAAPADDFNASKKGRLLPVKTIGEAIENVPAKHFKEAGAWVKTRVPVLVLRTNNELPKNNPSTPTAEP